MASLLYSSSDTFYELRDSSWISAMPPIVLICRDSLIRSCMVSTGCFYPLYLFYKFLIFFLFVSFFHRIRQGEDFPLQISLPAANKLTLISCTYKHRAGQGGWKPSALVQALRLHEDGAGWRKLSTSKTSSQLCFSFCFHTSFTLFHPFLSHIPEDTWKDTLV